MAVTVTCPACENSLPVSETLLGSKLRCKRCQQVFVAQAMSAGGKARKTQPATRPAPSRRTTTPLLLGAGSALLLTTGVMIWALFVRPGATHTTEPSPADTAAAVVPTIDLVEAAADDADPEPNTAAMVALAPAAQPVVAAKTTKPIAGFSESPRVLPATLDKDLMEKVKRSAVQIRAIIDEGAGEGSGWFAEPGIIVTNAHVVNMLEDVMPPPHSLRVFLYRGTKDEKEVAGTLLAVDRENDLAIIRVKDKNLPEPMPIAPSSELPEGMPLKVIGYPLGSQLARVGGARDQAATTISVRNTTVAGRVSFKNAGVRYIQLEGGADHGNSGGAIIDNAGYVRCVLDAGLPGTNMRFGIPSEYAVYLLQGRITKMLPGQCYRSGSTIKQPVVATIVDPLKRIKHVSVEIWSGDIGTRSRPATDSRPTPQPGDSPRGEGQLAYNPDAPTKLGEGRLASGQIDLPPLREGQVYWIQPKYERIDGSVRWGEAVVGEFCGIPVDRNSANLTVKHESGRQSWVDIETLFGAGVAPEGHAIPFRKTHWKTKLLEKTRQIESDGSARVQLSMKEIAPGNDEQLEFGKEFFGELSKAADGMKIEMTVTNRGLIKSPKSNVVDVPEKYRAFLERVNSQVIQSLEALGMALPAKDVSAGEEWFFDIPYKIYLGKDKSEDITYRLSYKLEGTRKRNGRDEAVITFEGRIVKGTGGSTAGDATSGGTPPSQIDEQKEREKGIFGIALGSAVVDLQTGLTSLARSKSNVAIDVKVKQRVRDNNGEEKDVDVAATFAAVGETTMQRVFNESDKRVNPSFFLPNQDVELNPFVGVASESQVVSVAGSDAGGNLGDAAGMPKEVLDRVKKLACLVRCKRDDGGGDGSGWLAEPGIVVTNAHVIGMVDRAARPPISVDVYFNAGTPDVKKYPVKILLVDHDNDLAVLELPTKESLPPPLKIVPSPDLHETQRLFVLGFPFGQGLGQQTGSGMDPLTVQLKVRNSSVMGRTENVRTGLLKYIRVEGGLTPGNSGGALVDMNGDVRCVAVAVVPRSEKHIIGLCIPSEYAQRLLWGYPLEIHPKLPYQADSTIAKLPVEVKFGDPMKRVKKVWLEYWTGTPRFVTLAEGGRMQMPRRSSETKPKAWPDDSSRNSVECEYDPENMLAKGEVPLTDIDPGYAYWIQPRYIDGTGQEKWGEAVFYAPEGSPIERREVMLKPKFPKGSARVIEVDTEANYRYVVLGEDRGHRMTLSARMSERMLGIDPQTKLQGVEYRFDKILFAEPRTRPEAIQLLMAGIQNPQQLEAQIRRLIMRGGFTSDGLMTKSVVDTTQVNDPVHQVMYTQFANQILEAIQLMCVKFPNKAVQYGETWEQPLNLHVETRKKHEPALYKLTMKYQGVRERGGRREAVIEIKGSIARDEKAETIDLKTKDSKDDDEDSDDEKAPDAGGGASSTMQAPKPKDSGKQAPKDKGNGKDKDKGDEASPPAGGNRPLYGLVRGVAYIDLENGAVALCRMYIDIDTEITVKDRQTKADMPVRAGGTIQLKIVRHASDK